MGQEHPRIVSLRKELELEQAALVSTKVKASDIPMRTDDELAAMAAPEIGKIKAQGLPMPQHLTDAGIAGYVQTCKMPYLEVTTISGEPPTVDQVLMCFAHADEEYKLRQERWQERYKNLPSIEQALGRPINPTDNQPPQPDLVNHPSHYNKGISDFGRLILTKCFHVDAADLDCECIDFIVKFADNNDYLATAPSGESFLAGNAIKYLWRAGLKGDAVQDLRKAAFSLERWDSEGFASECFSMADAVIMVFAEIDRLETVNAATAWYSEGLGCK
jgi:hypothetical protein